MALSVSMGERSRRRFDRLRAELASTLGREVSPVEFFDLLADVADEERERLVARAAGVRLPLSERDKKRLLSTGSDWGVATSSEDIDRFLYGRKPSGRRRVGAGGRGA